jgi:hypothetical protein
MILSIGFSSPFDGNLPADVMDRWNQAITFLSTTDQTTGRSPLETYALKELQLTQVIKDKEEAIQAIHDQVMYGDAAAKWAPVRRTETLELWQRANMPIWNAKVKDAWMDWVVQGRKLEVEHAFQSMGLSVPGSANPNIAGQPPISASTTGST